MLSGRQIKIKSNTPYWTMLQFDQVLRSACHKYIRNASTIVSMVLMNNVGSVN